MAMLDRYRKPGGFLQLVSLLETSPPAKQEKFLALIRDESPAWERELKKRVLSFSRIMSWNPDTLSEIWARVPEKVIATAIWHFSPDQKTQFFGNVSIALKRKMDETFAMNPPTEGEVIGCQLKILQEIRTMSGNGMLRLEKVDPEAAIPEKVEDLLNDPSGSIPGDWEKKVLAAAAPSAQSSVDSSTPAAPAASPAAVMLVEEMKELRKKLQSAAVEIQTLKSENQQMRDKLEQIKKIA